MGNTMALPQSSEWLQGPLNFARHCIELQSERWEALCFDFLERERVGVLQGDPDAATLQQHCLALSMLIRGTNSMLANANDPDIDMPDVSRRLDNLRWRLTQSWKILHNPLQPNEADKIIAECFPS